MPPIVLVTPRSGQIELQKWFDQGPILEVELLSDFIQPQQDMLEFQQRRFWGEDTISLTIGQNSQFTIRVPEDQAWEIDLINLINGDTGDRDFQMSWIAPTSSLFPRMPMWRGTVDSLIVTNIFPVRNAFTITNSRSRFEMLGRIKLGPDEALLIQSLDPLAAAGPLSDALRFKAHRIPIPVEAVEIPGLVTGVAV